MSKYYVYRHIRLDSNTPFNIGKGSKNRAFSTNNRNTRWHNIVNKSGYKVEILKYFTEESDAFKFEKEMIALYKALGYCEANLTDGGEGVSGYKHTSIVKQNLRSLKLGSKKTLQCRMKMSKSHGSKDFQVWTSKKHEGKHNKVKYLGTFSNQNECARVLNINVGGIHMVLKGKRPQTNGYIFEYSV